MGLLKKLFFPQQQVRGSFPNLENPSTPLEAFFVDAPATTSGVQVSENNAMNIATVYSCVKVIAETMGLMDLEVVEKIGKTTRVNQDHPIYWLLYAEPSPNYNRFEWIQALLTRTLLWGNGYSEIIRDKFAQPKELQLLDPWDVTSKVNSRGRLFYEYQTKDAGPRPIIPENMVHIKNLNATGLVGLSPVSIQRENLANRMAKDKHEGAFYGNGAKASGILMMPGHLSDKAQKNVKESFNEQNEGVKNRFKTLFLEDGVKYQQLTIPQNDAQFLESKKFDRSEIAGWFRVPPYKVGDIEQNYSNMEAQERSFAKDCIVPWTVRLQQEFNRKLFFEDERGRVLTQFNLDDLIKGDMKTRYESYQIAVNTGWLKPGEAREAEGWGTEGAEEIDGFFMNSAMKPVKNIIAETDPANQQQQNQNQNAAA